MSRTDRPQILHLFGGFDDGPEADRAIAAIEALGEGVGHAIVVEEPAARAASAHLPSGISVTWPKFPSLAGKPWPGRLKGLAAAMSGYDLICTNGWAAVDAAMAHTLFADVHKLPPLVHHEFAPDPEELSGGGSLGRKAYRRIAFGRSAAIITASQAAERMALQVWQQPRTRVQLIGAGIDTRSMADTPARDVLPSFIKRKGEFWIGTLADHADRAGLAQLVAALGELPEEWQVVVLGDVEAELREAVLTEAEEIEVDHRLHFTGAADWREVVGLFDILALPVLSDDAGKLVAGAMAAGVPLVVRRGGEIGAMPSSDNGPYLVGERAGESMLEQLGTLALDPGARKRVGKANRDKAREQFDAKRLLARQLALYRSLLSGRDAGGTADKVQNRAQNKA